MKRHLLNIFLLGMLLLGYAIVTNTGFGWVLMAVPTLVWGKPVLRLVHKNRWAAALFWTGLIWLKWQLALPLFLLYLALKGTQKITSLFSRDETLPKAHHNYVGEIESRFEMFFNPATGKPMMGLRDTEGNPYGVNLHVSDLDED